MTRIPPKTINLPKGDYFDQFYMVVGSAVNDSSGGVKHLSYGGNYFSTRPTPRSPEELGGIFTLRDSMGFVVLIVKNPGGKDNQQ